MDTELCNTIADFMSSFIRINLQQPFFKPKGHRAISRNKTCIRLGRRPKIQFFSRKWWKLVV